jgi:hypothetical protein
MIGQTTVGSFAKGQHDEISFQDVDSSE